MLDESTFDKFLKKNTLVANFINMRNMSPVTITVISGQIGRVTIYSDQMNIAGDII
jgi:hypothetical protein